MSQTRWEGREKLLLNRNVEFFLMSLFLCSFENCQIRFFFFMISEPVGHVRLPIGGSGQGGKEWRQLAGQTDIVTVYKLEAASCLIDCKWLRIKKKKLPSHF